MVACDVNHMGVMSLAINIYIIWSYRSIYESALHLIAPVQIKIVVNSAEVPHTKRS